MGREVPFPFLLFLRAPSIAAPASTEPICPYRPLQLSTATSHSSDAGAFSAAWHVVPTATARTRELRAQLDCLGFPSVPSSKSLTSPMRPAWVLVGVSAVGKPVVMRSRLRGSCAREWSSKRGWSLPAAPGIPSPLRLSTSDGPQGADAFAGSAPLHLPTLNTLLTFASTALIGAIYLEQRSCDQRPSPA